MTAVLLILVMFALGRKPNAPHRLTCRAGRSRVMLAKTTSGVTLPDNSVADPTDVDRFQSVKSATDNRVKVGRIPAD